MCQSTVVHLLSLLDELENLVLGLRNIGACWQPLATCSLREILVSQVEVALQLAAILGTLSPLVGDDWLRTGASSGKFS